MQYYIYNNTTGIIEAVGFSPPASVDRASHRDSEGILNSTTYKAAVASAKASLLSDITNTGQTAKEGIANPKTQKVDIATGDLVDYTPPVKVIDYAGANRSTRDDLLKETDWTQVPDSPLTATKKAEWMTYRQGLRNLPENVSTFTTAYLTEDDLPSKPS